MNSQKIDLYSSKLKSWFLAVSALPQNFCSRSSLASRQCSLAPNKNFKEPPGQIPNLSIHLSIGVAFWLLFMTSCSASRSNAEQVQLLKDQLSSAELSLQKEQKKIKQLQQQLVDAELNLIERNIALFEKKGVIERNSEEITKLFLQERETLHRMIQEGIPRAQTLLDRILQLITQISDANNS